MNQADALSAVSCIRTAEKDQRYGFPIRRDVPTIRALIDNHLSAINNVREATRAKRVLNVLSRIVPANLKITEFVSPHIQDYVNLRRQDGLKDSSIDRELNIISSMLHRATERFPSLINWIPPKIPRPKHSKRRRERVITTLEIAKVLTYLYSSQYKGETEFEAANRRNVGHVFQTAFLTGARKGELCKLQWDQVNWDAMEIQIVGTKTEHRCQQTVRYLKISNTLAEILREREIESRGSYVFTRNGGEVTHYYQILAHACEAVGVTYGREMPRGFVTHDARHTAVTRMLHDGRDLATIGSITGHTDKRMILRYGHASRESRDEAIDVLEKFAGNENLGLGLDTSFQDALIYSGIPRGLVPEVGLEPT